jgi:hypothetical protein
VSDLVRARERYESTPRRLDEALEGMARGDRGCAADVVAALGALVTLAGGLGVALGALPLGAPFLGVAGMVAGWLLGGRARTRSSELRTRALREGPLVFACLVEPDPRLRAPGRPVSRGAAVFCTDPARRFDGAYLARVADGLRASTVPRSPEVSAVLADRFAPGMPVVPEPAGGNATFVANVVVYGERLPDGASDAKPPLIACIVDIPSGFIEHV